MRTILHIGMDKTGTSALQASLAAQRTHLAASGVIYPDIDGRPDHQALLHDSKRLLPSNGQTLVLSHEGFFPAGPDRLASLIQDLPGACSIHVWIRDPSRYVDAAFRQRCREARSELHLTALLRAAELPPRINPVAHRCVARYRMLERWKEAHGQDLFVHDYEQDRHNIVDAFAKATGIEVADQSGRSNRSPSLRALHALSLERGAGRDPDPNEFLKAAIELGESSVVPIVPAGVAAWCRLRSARILDRVDTPLPHAEPLGPADRHLDRNAASELALRVRKLRR